MKNILVFITAILVFFFFFYLQQKQVVPAKVTKKLSARELRWEAGKKEAKIFQRIAKDTIANVPVANYEYAIAARINASAETNVENSFSRYRFEEKRVEKSELSSFFEILNDSSSYGAVQAACFEPQISVVLYDSIQQPIEVYLICLDCNHIESSPSIKAYNSGLTKKAHKKLREIINDKWNLHYYSCSDFFEGEKECNTLTQKRIKDSTRIKKEIKKYQTE